MIQVKGIIIMILRERLYLILLLDLGIRLGMDLGIHRELLWVLWILKKIVILCVSLNVDVDVYVSLCFLLSNKLNNTFSFASLHFLYQNTAENQSEPDIEKASANFSGSETEITELEKNVPQQ